MKRCKVVLNNPLVVFYTIPLALWGFWFLVDFNGLYGQDSHEYLRYTRRLLDFWTSGSNPGDYFWPLDYPLYGSLLALVIHPVTLALQLLSMLSLVFTGVYLYRLLRLFYPDTFNNTEALLYLGLLFLFSPLILLHGGLVMSDMLAALFTTAAVFHGFSYYRRSGGSDFLWTVFFSASAVMTRYPAILIIGIPLLLVAYRFIQCFRPTELLLATVVVGLCICPHLWIRGEQTTAFLNHPWLQSWSFKNAFLSSFDTLDGKADYRFPNLVYSFSNFFHPAFCGFGIALLVFTRAADFRSRERLLLLVPMVIYALFLAGIPFQNLRFLILTFPLVLVWMYPLFRRMRRRLLKTNKLLATFLVLGLLVQSSLLYKYFAPIYHSNRLEILIAQSLRQYPGRPIYTFWMDGPLRTYGVKNRLINLWNERLTRIDSTGLILFNERKFNRQWAGKNPMINWQFIRETRELGQLQSFPDGWKLYEIGPENYQE